MTNYALLNNVDHQDLRVITERSAEYGDDLMFVPTFPNEFRNVQAEYPILFHRNDQGEYYPVALFGFRDRENLYLDEAGWHAHYIPAMVRRQPFLIGYQEDKDNPGGDSIRVLSIDMDHPRVNRDSGEALFQPLGGRTEFLEDMANLLEIIFEGSEHNKAFVAALTEHELIESVTFDITLDDGSRNQLLGFYAIDEDRLQSLPGSVLEHFSREGFLMPLFMALASTGNIRRLVDIKNRSLAG